MPEMVVRLTPAWRANSARLVGPRSNKACKTSPRFAVPTIDDESKDLGALSRACWTEELVSPDCGRSVTRLAVRSSIDANSLTQLATRVQFNDALCRPGRSTKMETGRLGEWEMAAISSTNQRAQSADKSGAAASRANGRSSSAGTARPAPEVAVSPGGMITLKGRGTGAPVPAA